MQVANLKCRGGIGIEAPLVGVEVHIARGLPKFLMSGLAATAVKESKHRVRSAILTAGFDFPLQRITVNLSPADLPKNGCCFDLPIALGILIASRQIKVEVNEYELVGELALSGALQPVTRMLPILLAAAKAKHKVIMPTANLPQANWVESKEIYPAANLLEVIKHLTAVERIDPYVASLTPMMQHANCDMAEVQGQAAAKRGMEIAAAGGHHMLMIGAPGVGKSMLAARFNTILPPLDLHDAQVVAAIHMQHSQGFKAEEWKVPPYRAPHHSSSTVALLGGGQVPMPGEISLAHNGVLFLDEWPEFSRSSKEALREPLSTGVVHIARAQYRVSYPARFQLIAAMNPCPCGYWQDGTDRCRCSFEQIKKYQGRISGPLLDRIDIKLRIMAPPANLLLRPQQQETSAAILERVQAARQLQFQRNGRLNSQLDGKQMQQYVHLSEQLRNRLSKWAEQKQASLRSINKVLKVARTIADLAGVDIIAEEHLSEAVGYFT